MLGGDFRDVVGRQGGGVGEGLVVVPGDSCRDDKEKGQEQEQQSNDV